jgi:hypothetical protein
LASAITRWRKSTIQAPWTRPASKPPNKDAHKHLKAAGFRRLFRNLENRSPYSCCIAA